MVRGKAGKAFVNHAAGNKDLADRLGGEYAWNMKFIGAFVTRFEQ